MTARSRAFTLIEVMIALFVLALAFIGVMGTSSHVSRTVTLLEEKTVGLWVAQNAVAEIILDLSGGMTQDVNKHGDMRMLGKTWFWTATSVSEEKTERVTVTVSDHRGGKALATFDFLYFNLPPVLEDNNDRKK